VTQPRFAAHEITMTDRFGTWQATVKKPASLCAPVEVETMGDDDPSAYFTCYKLVGDRGGAGSHLPEVGMMGLFGTHKVKLRSATSLCLPSGRDDAPGPGLDPLRCYRAALAAGQPSQEARELSFRDDLDERRGSARRIKEVCLPAQMGQDVSDPDLVVACYSLKDATGQERYSGEHIPLSNAFGDQTLRTNRGSTVCVPVSEVALP
jgi:hypothetical protein